MVSLRTVALSPSLRTVALCSPCQGTLGSPRARARRVAECGSIQEFPSRHSARPSHCADSTQDREDSCGEGRGRERFAGGGGKFEGWGVKEQGRDRQLLSALSSSTLTSPAHGDSTIKPPPLSHRRSQNFDPKKREGRGLCCCCRCLLSRRAAQLRAQDEGIRHPFLLALRFMQAERTRCVPHPGDIRGISGPHRLATPREQRLCLQLSAGAALRTDLTPPHVPLGGIGGGLAPSTMRTLAF